MDIIFSLLILQWYIKVSYRKLQNKTMWVQRLYCWTSLHWKLNTFIIERANTWNHNENDFFITDCELTVLAAVSLVPLSPGNSVLCGRVWGKATGLTRSHLSMKWSAYQKSEINSNNSLLIRDRPADWIGPRVVPIDRSMLVQTSV